MSGYIGILPVPQATETRNSFTATSNQTSFATDGYTPNFVSVYLNGVLLSAADFTATNGTDVVLASGAAADDVVEVIAFSTFQSADALPLTGGSISGNVSFGDNNKAIFGAGSDLQIYHDGSNSYIDDAGTGTLNLRGQDNVIISRPDGSATSAIFDTNGAVQIRYNNSTKIATTATGVEVTGAATVGGAAVKVAGKESIYVPAAAMYPSTTNPCSDLTQVETTALRPDLKVLDFAAAADDFAQFTIAFPKSWNEGTITYQPFWTVTGTNTGTVVWQLGGIAVSSDDTINTAFGTLVATTALAHSGTSNDLMVSAESGAVTIAGSPAANDMCFFQINNDASASGQTGVARLLGIKLFFTTDAANDA
mgnify:FL=1